MAEYFDSALDSAEGAQGSDKGGHGDMKATEEVAPLRAPEAVPAH